MPKSITQNTLLYRDNLPILREYFPSDMPKSVPSQTFKQAEKFKKKEGKQGELGI
jgi:hypothetical protein